MLGNTLYITNEYSYLSLDGENVVIKREEKEVARRPLHNIENIVAFGYTGASPALMYACAKNKIGLCFMTPYGKFLARVCGKQYGNVVLRKTQYRISDDESSSAIIARNFILGKIHNSKWVIERAIRDHKLRLDIIKLKSVSDKLSNSMIAARTCSDLEQLRGIEGEAASLYFSVFDDLILQQKDKFYFNCRNKRPPTDNVNALLSFCYTLLANEVASALETTGLDPYVGFMHRDRPGRVSLALDVMEELRAPMADRFVLSLINKKIVSGSDFYKMEDGAVRMNDESKKLVLSKWQNKKSEVITHPFLNEKMEWGFVSIAQSMLLSRFLREDLDEYPVFLWK